MLPVYFCAIRPYGIFLQVLLMCLHATVSYMLAVYSIALLDYGAYFRDLLSSVLKRPTSNRKFYASCLYSLTTRLGKSSFWYVLFS